MPCFYPLNGYRAKKKAENGKRRIVFSLSEGLSDRPVTVPCGQCIGCRLEYSRQWAIRCMHEASLHQDNCYITLTYDDDNLPVNGSLIKSHFVVFMKKLRKLKEFKNREIRFYMCGEYGEIYGRPHYHAILFNMDFKDKTLFKVEKGFRLYTSESLGKLWKYGHHAIGDVTFHSAAYVARYVVKKVNGKMIDKEIPKKFIVNGEEIVLNLKPYEKVNFETGEIVNVEKEYCNMSRKYGIGKKWYEKYKSDVYPNDKVIVNSFPVNPPKYYDKLFELDNEKKFKKLKVLRKLKSKKVEGMRLDALEECAKKRLAMKKKSDNIDI